MLTWILLYCTRLCLLSSTFPLSVFLFLHLPTFLWSFTEEVQFFFFSFSFFPRPDSSPPPWLCFINYSLSLSQTHPCVILISILHPSLCFDLYLSLYFPTVFTQLFLSPGSLSFPLSLWDRTDKGLVSISWLFPHQPPPLFKTPVSWFSTTSLNLPNNRSFKN